MGTLGQRGAFAPAKTIRPTTIVVSADDRRSPYLSIRPAQNVRDRDSRGLAHDVHGVCDGAGHRTRQLPPVQMQAGPGTLVLEGLESTPGGGRVPGRTPAAPDILPGRRGSSIEPSHEGSIARLVNPEAGPSKGRGPSIEGSIDGPASFDERSSSLTGPGIERSKQAIGSSIIADRSFDTRTTKLRGMSIEASIPGLPSFDIYRSKVRNRRSKVRCLPIEGSRTGPPSFDPYRSKLRNRRSKARCLPIEGSRTDPPSFPA
jgi:hypothetical protein